MIRSFRHRGLKRLFEADDRRRLPARDIDKIRRILGRLNMATTPKDMEAPGFHLHPLKGDRRGFWAVTVRANWRIVFRFEEGDSWNVDYTDYH